MSFMQKVERALDLFIEFLEKNRNEPLKAEAKPPRAKKEKATALPPTPAQPAAPSEDPMSALMGAAGSQEQKKEEAPRQMTGDESAIAAQEMAKACVARFTKPGAEGKPEGFHLAFGLLRDHFKVARLADLIHPQRVEFIAKIKELIAAADAKGQA